MNALPYLKEWDLTPDGPVEKREFSVIQPVTAKQGPALLKVFKKGSDEIHSASMLRYYNGVGAVRLLQGNSQAILIERIAPVTPLKALVENGKDDEALAILVDTVETLQQPKSPPQPHGLTPLRARFKALFRKAEKDRRQNHESLFVLAAKEAEKLLSEEKERRVLHGDIHHENILLSSRGWIAIDPVGLIGELTYEFANVFSNPAGLPNIVHDPARMRKQAQIIAGQTALDEKRLLAFAFVHSALAACWCMEDGHDPRHKFQCAEIVKNLLDQSA